MAQNNPTIISSEELVETFINIQEEDEMKEGEMEKDEWEMMAMPPFRRLNVHQEEGLDISDKGENDDSYREPIVGCAPVFCYAPAFSSNVDQNSKKEGCCIYRAPKPLREVRESAYTPQIISIGPLHSNNPKLFAMEKHKRRYKLEFLERVTKRGKEEGDLVEIIQKNEKKIRGCYDETISMRSKKFKQMVLLDSAFIIELFLVEHEKGPTYFKPWQSNAIGLDLMLLENQLPFFILEDLYNAVIGESYFPFNNLVERYFCKFLAPECQCSCVCGHNLNNHHRRKPQRKFRSCDCSCSWLYCFWFTNCFSADKTENEQKRPDPKDLKPKHLTDFVRLHRSWKHPPKSDHPIENVFSATKLREAGVKFKVSSEAWPLYITFEKGELKLPLFEVYDYTESLIRNLMAFEQCYCPHEAYICNYMSLIDFLINSEEDVDLLVEQGVIVNWLGDNEKVSKIVNDLCLQIVDNGSCFEKVGEKLNAHYGNWWYGSVATMRSVYFTNIWKGTGTIVALAVLFFTLTQSIYSLKQIF